jgi:hypothetical protein
MNKMLVRVLILAAFLPVLVSCSGMSAAPSVTFPPTDTITPTPTITLTPTPRPTATITYTPTLAPAQVFAEPILAVVEDIPPQFADDFSQGNHGWSWDGSQRDQVQIMDGVMKVDGKGGSGIFPPHNLLYSKNFIFEFDVRMLNADTEIGTFFHQGDSNIGYLFVIQGDRQWHLHISKTDEDLSGGQNIQPLGMTNHIVIIARDDEFAVYLNGLPTAYLKDETSLQAGRLMPTFNSSGTGYIARGEFDNFKFWDLDLVKGLP